MFFLDVGFRVGLALGDSDGESLGLLLGLADGESLGLVDGADVGSTVLSQHAR